MTHFRVVLVMVLVIMLVAWAACTPVAQLPVMTPGGWM